MPEKEESPNLKFYLERVVDRDSAIDLGDLAEPHGIGVYLESGHNFQTPRPSNPGTLVFWVNDETRRESAIFECRVDKDNEVFLGGRLKPFLKSRLKEAEVFLASIPEKVPFSKIEDCRKLRFTFDKVRIIRENFPERGTTTLFTHSALKLQFPRPAKAIAVSPSSRILIVKSRKGALLAVFLCSTTSTGVSRGTPLGFTFHFLSDAYRQPHGEGPRTVWLEMVRELLGHPDYYRLRIPSFVPADQLEPDSLTL